MAISRFQNRVEEEWGKNSITFRYLNPEDFYMTGYKILQNFKGNALLKGTRILWDGEVTMVFDVGSGALLCRGQFLREFESSGKSYTRFVELTGISGLAIGGNPGCQIVVRDEALGSDSILLQRQGNRWLLAENHTRYGMAVNGVYRTGQKVINDYDFFSLVGHGFFLRGDRLYFETSADVQARGLTVKEHRDSLTRMEYPKLNQSTRVYYKVPEETIEIQNPPQKEKPQEKSLLATIAPALSMLAITVLLRGVMNGGSTYVIISACTMSVGIITSVYNYLNQNKESEKHEQERISAYTGYIQRKDGEIQALRQKETALMDINTPDIDATLNSVWRFDGHLYERRIGNEDYLSVRLGTGVVESKCPVKYKAQEFRDESDPMTLWPEQVEQKYHNLPQAPVLVSLAETGTLGIVGSKEAQQSTVRMMTVDLAVHHSHQRLQMAFMYAEKDQDRWEWARWLRHVNNPVNGCRNLVYDEDSYKIFVEFLYKELCERESLAGRRNVVWPVNYIVFVMEPFELMRHPISKYIAGAQDYGVCFVFCAEAEELLPPCQRLIRTQGTAASLIEAADGNHVQAYRPQAVQEAQLMRMAVKMACVTIDEVSLAAQLTRNITLYKLLGIYGADDLDLKSRWAKSEVYKSMAAPLGVSLAGVVSLDLHDKAHGPHGLVAGTTGSGKSELLQTYILSMITLFHPYEVAFVIIDFKGGGMVNQFRGLPHLLGAITNIDGKEIDRSLKSIKAELRTRQQLFANADVNHIDKYIRKYKSGEVKVPLPHLIIIVDEFAELKAEQPEFMKELISAARIGRSLGVHLILATQKPSGQVNEQIWSNSRFKLCLKVQSQSDSNEVLKSPLAAEIKEPGRAYLQVGNDEIFELFQSAYSGAPDKADDLNVREFAINSVAVSGKRTPIYVQKKKKSDEGSMTQLAAVVKYVTDYCEKADIQKLPDICLPSLETCIDFKTPDAEQKDPGRYYVEIGIYDDPDSQFQGGYKVDIGSNNIIIIGSSQTGKTNMLQNIIRSLSVQYTPDEVNIYIIDFASMVLKNFEKLNHVGGVVCPSEDEKLKNLFKLLRTEIDERKEILISVGVSSFTA
ncbi:MAG: type VII secretion protein EssC [Lachnospiraceae bacterium]|nr:type VII secretion protein EssC [Lachnospiraceae bacterium]